MLATYLLAADFRGIGLSVAAIVFLGFIAVFVWNIVRARPELGSEIELAANRKEYLSDEELEGEKLDRSLSFALVLLTLLAITLPFYWIAEPGRQDGAVAAYNLSFESRGEGSYLEGAQCANCHVAGGVGGTAAYVLQDADGQFLANASWKAPALNNVLLRYSEEEVRYILNFGRPGSPMAAWGTVGGGPLTTQQVDNIIIYLRTLQLQSLDPLDIALAGGPTMDDEESQAALAAAEEIEAEIRAEVERSVAEGEYATIGEAVFNLGLQRDLGGGAYSCARCHTAGWSLGLDVQPDILTEGVAGCGGGNPSGIGFNLCGGSVKERFPDDTWLLPDGTWYGPSNPSGYDGSFVLAMDGSEVALNAGGAPVNDADEAYLILSGTEENPDQNGDLADCGFVSGLWQPDGGLAYPYDPAIALQNDEANPRAFVDPALLTLEEVLASVSDDAFTLANGKIVADCTIIEMPPRTSLAHYNLIAQGADAGVGYGEGGLSAAGMMPGFAKMLPADLIQAVVDYERGL
jgi:mono/diheme cytochrome c family protein